MRRFIYVLLAGLVLSGLFTLSTPANADHEGDPHTKNLHPMGHDVAPATFLVPPAEREVHSDLAFWGKLAIQGNYSGFRILDISAPGNPKLITFQECDGDQGDVSVWESLVIRSTNSPNPGGRLCDGQPVPDGFEGIHVFDIGNPADPVLITGVATECGSHTHTLVPDTGNNRLLVYNNPSSSSCPWMEIIEIPLDNPAGAQVIHMEPLFGGATRCHDVGVITAGINRAACASGARTNVFDISNLADPVPLFTISEEGVGIGGNWHSAAFTWDGKVIVLGWEPGGGSRAECEADDPAVKKSLFFYDAATGAKLGQWTLPRPQSALENCTIHNYNVVPLHSGRYVLVHGSYQSGTSVVDFTDPANPFEVAYSDPPPLEPRQLGGVWSSYWYNHFMYESNITEGLNIFRLSDNVTAGAIRLPYLNPQTQDFSLPLHR